MPALQAAIANAELSVSKARKIVPVLTPENQEEWIEKAKSLPQRELERQVARLVPQEAERERFKSLDGERVQVTVTISEELLTKLKKIQDLESQRTKRAVSLEEAMNAAVKTHLERNDPIEKAERARKALPVARQVGRHPLPAARTHEVNCRDQVQCTYTHEGARCANRRWLEIHHVTPVSKGGGNELENLKTLCHAHHQMLHAS
ncbi:MAG: HNH endonuclease [Bdellovibrionota bacterium]